MITRRFTAEKIDEAIDIFGNEVAKLSGEFEFEIRRKKRTDRQNRALHLYFGMLANELNEKHLYFARDFFKEGFETEWSAEMVKELLWRPIQKAITGETSSKKITTDQVNKIVEILDRGLAHKGILVNFPNQYDNDEPRATAESR